MRIAVGDPGAVVASVTVDGMLASHCVEASEEGGWVREIRRDANGKVLVRGDYALVRMRAGAVKITVPA